MKRQLLSAKQHLQASKMGLENQESTIRKLEAQVQNIPSTSGSGQAPPPNSKLEARLESIFEQIDRIDGFFFVFFCNIRFPRL